MTKPIPSDFVRPLLTWYEQNKRVLPWRGDVSPYQVWVSEIMLQQTRVETVKPYYTRWINALPTISDLAAAGEETVLKLWEGLGYYSRVRNLKKAAETVVRDFGGFLPNNAKDLQKLPGIGAYTAGAILSIAFGQKEPAVDGNVLRVISRLTCDPFDITDVKVRAEIADKLRPLMPDGKTSDFTQALFEIGALVCLPDNEYRCEVCPLCSFCAACRENKQASFPVRPEKAAKKEFSLTVFVLSYQGKFALKKRPDKGLLAGLYELPNVNGFLTPNDVSALYRGSVTPLTEATHVFTHLKWNMRGYLIELDSLPPDDTLLFLSPAEILSSYPLPSAFSAYKKYIARS